MIGGHLLKIGIMLRHIDEKGGISVYTDNLLHELFSIDNKNQYLLLHNGSKSIESYSKYPNVYMKKIKMPTKFLWDQIAIPWVTMKEKLDLVFNPKLSIPLMARSKKSFTFHGAEQFVHKNIFKFYDRIYFSIFMPLFIKKADMIISPTKKGIDDMESHFKVNKSKIKAIHHGLNSNFLNKENPSTLLLENIRSEYKLPEKIILFVGGITPLKNISNILYAFDKFRKKHIGYKLVLIGFRRWNFKNDIELINKLGLEDDVVLPGWVQDKDLPYIYCLADLFIFPSIYEGFGIPLIEAMSCGCPIVTSNAGGLPEIAGDAAVLVNPYDVDEISTAMCKVIDDSDLQKNLISNGYRQVKNFSWNKCAHEVLNEFNKMGEQNPR